MLQLTISDTAVQAATVTDALQHYSLLACLSALPEEQLE